jgi:hypothetical protein
MVQDGTYSVRIWHIFAGVGIGLVLIVIAVLAMR